MWRLVAGITAQASISTSSAAAERGASCPLIIRVTDRPSCALRYAINAAKLTIELGWMQRYKLIKDWMSRWAGISTT